MDMIATRKADAIKDNHRTTKTKGEEQEKAEEQEQDGQRTTEV